LTNSEAYLALRQELGLDRPLPEQYLNWMGSVLRGDLGTSFRDRQPITNKVVSHIVPTLQLATMAMGVALLIAVPTGIVSALRPRSALDTLATVVALGGVAIPSFFLGILLIYLFAVGLDLVPPSGYVPPWENLGMNLKLMILPALTLGSGFAAVLMRQIRGALIDVMQRDYVVTARAKGLTEKRLIVSHAIKNALIPVITIIGLQIGGLVGGTAVIETIFSIPGMGRLIVDSIFFRDYPTVQAVVLLLALAVLVANFLTDLLYAYVDPRIRYGS
ncbi:MAG: ABC transporter permease, partial [Chloroflexota bacterium]|nr:ABC transporter permease [Chloroflexota bacterium]